MVKRIPLWIRTIQPNHSILKILCTVMVIFFFGKVYFIFYINSTASQICLLINALSLPAKNFSLFFEFPVSFTLSRCLTGRFVPVQWKKKPKTRVWRSRNRTRFSNFVKFVDDIPENVLHFLRVLQQIPGDNFCRICCTNNNKNTWGVLGILK